MKRLLAMVACLLLAGWSDGTSRYQLDLTIERDGQAVGGQLGLQGDAALREQAEDWTASLSTVVAGKTLYVTFSAPRAGSQGVAVAQLMARGYATNLLTCEANAHDGMVVLPDTGCACRDVDFVLAFRCPGADGRTGTSDDEVFRFEGTISASGAPCAAKPKPWFPGSLKTGYRKCATTTPPPPPAPSPTPAPPPPAPPIYDEGGCHGSSDSEWDGGCGGYDDGYGDYDDYDSGGGGCESSGDSDWGSSDSGGCEGDSSSDDSSSQSCEGDAYAATAAPQHRKARFWPAWGVNLPTVLMVFLGSLALFRTRRRRRQRSDG